MWNINTLRAEYTYTKITNLKLHQTQYFYVDQHAEFSKTTSLSLKCVEKDINQDGHHFDIITFAKIVQTSKIISPTIIQF